MRNALIEVLLKLLSKLDKSTSHFLQLGDWIYFNGHLYTIQTVDQEFNLLNRDKITIKAEALNLNWPQKE